MASTNYGVNANEAVKLWSRKLFREALNATTFAQFIGEGSDSIIQLKDDTSKGPGDRVRCTLRAQLGGDGIDGDSTLEGQEEALSTYTDDIVIDQLRHAVRSGGQMSEQRIPFSVRNEAMLGLKDWWADRIDTWIANQLAGNTVPGTKFTGLQAVTAYDSNHIIRADANTDDANLLDVASDRMTLTLIADAVETAETLKDNGTDGIGPIRPVMVGGEPYYVLFMHPYQARDLRTNTDTGQWLDIQKAAMQGGRVSDNPIFTGALGVYNQVILHKNFRMPLGVSNAGANVASTRRAVLCGAQAAVMALGREGSPTEMFWVEKLFDYDNQLGVSAGMIGGVKRTIFNSETFGSIAISTGAA